MTASARIPAVRRRANTAGSTGSALVGIDTIVCVCTVL
jgi:hypothetical protein